MKLIALAFAATLLLPTPVAGAATTNLTVRLDSGRVHGIATTTTRQFLGIPYASADRWTMPRPVPHWNGVRPATKRGSNCPQTASGPGQPASADENCLFVNVTTPLTSTRRQLPVMVWWHGGGYTTGDGADYNADRIASQGDVIVVTINYRLGIFGYFGLPGLPGSGNFGLADQIASLKWVKHNAAAFGGDRNNVTVFGESAGGMSTCAMLTSPRAFGLVDKAAISSGSCRLNWPAGGLFPGAPADTPYTSLRKDTADGIAAAKSLGCSGVETLKCMRRVPPAKLLPLNQDFSDHLAYGTPMLPLNPATALDLGAFMRVPLISGGNRDEARSFMAGALAADPTLITAKTYPALIRTAFGKAASRVAAEYPLAHFRSAPLAWSTVITDSAWACPTAAADRDFAARTTVYPYEFADPNAPNLTGLNNPLLPQGAAHATDLPSFFNLGGYNLLKTPAQRDLSRTMIGYWTSFAWSGNPNHRGAPYWPANSDRQMRFIPEDVRTANVAADHDYAFWSTLR